ncbi:MAG: NUDIX hydrolase [Pseudomonadota bacterium]|jgi:8-oxo-dGTP pyrophosphatase MutT (NUDIX family)|nr:MAG: NUDIX hydrolase [Pseudomonadota bacterium]
MTWRPDLTVAAIVQRDDRFLIVEERIQGRLLLNQPAGHVEDGESIIDAAVRETLEETAWRLRPRHLVGLYLWRNPATGTSYLRAAIAGDVEQHDPGRALDEGIVAAHWMTRAELLGNAARHRSPLVMRCIDDHLAGRRHDLSALSYIDAQPVTAP